MMTADQTVLIEHYARIYAVYDDRAEERSTAWNAAHREAAFKREIGNVPETEGDKIDLATAKRLSEQARRAADAVLDQGATGRSQPV